MIREPEKIRTADMRRYLNESRGLERDYIGELIASRRAAWRVAASLGVLATLGLVAAIAGLKREPPPPIVLRVDNSTGAVDMMTTIRESETTYGEVVDIYWLNTYVLNRESYDYNNLQTLYNTTALLSSPEVQKEYYSIYQGPNARNEVMSDRTRILVAVRSITPSKEGGSASVRFTTQEKSGNGQTSEPKDLIATICYKYTDAPMSSEDRRTNPLGFQVTSYRVDPEYVKNSL